MRTIFVGIEYAGKTTLIQLLSEYYRHRQQGIHGDDHFTIPDSTLSPESRQLMVGFPRDVKERMQRMQIHYHVEVIRNYANTLISGWHMEEAVYSAAYGDDPDNPYYANYGYGHQRLYETMVLPRQEMFDSTEQILEDEGIRTPYSDDLRETWENRKK